MKNDELLGKNMVERKVKEKMIKAAFTKMWNEGQIEIAELDKKNKKVVFGWAWSNEAYGKVVLEGTYFDYFMETFPVDKLMDEESESEEEKTEEKEDD